MRYVKVRNVTRNVELGRKVRVASSFLDRAVGLLGTVSLNVGEGMWLSPCRSIHTFFMRYPIDVVFVGAEDTVLSQRTYPPWKISGWQTKSRGVLELTAGTLERTGTRVGDKITFDPSPLVGEGAGWGGQSRTPHLNPPPPVGRR